MIKQKIQSVNKELKENQKKCIFFTNKFQNLHNIFINHKQFNKLQINEALITLDIANLYNELKQIGAYRFFKNKKLKDIYEYLFKRKDIELLQKIMYGSVNQFHEIQNIFHLLGFSNYYYKIFELGKQRDKSNPPVKKKSDLYIHLQDTLNIVRKQIKLTKAQVSVLYYIYAFMNYSKSETVRLNQCIIAGKLGLTHKTVNLAIKELQQLGFIKFDSMQLSGRSNIFYSTNIGKKFFKKCFCSNTYHRFKDTFKVKYNNRRDVEKYKANVIKNQKCNTIYNNKNLYINSNNISHKNLLKKDKENRKEIFKKRFYDSLERKNKENVEKFVLTLKSDKETLRKIKQATYLQEKDIIFLAGRFKRYFSLNSHKLRFIRNLTNLFIGFILKTLSNEWIKPKDYYTEIVIIKHKRELNINNFN